MSSLKHPYTGAGQQGVLFSVPAAAPESAPGIADAHSLPALPGGDIKPDGRHIEPSPVRSSDPVSRPLAPATLWLAVALPELPLLAAANSGGQGEANAAKVLVEGQGVNQRVWRTNTAAAAAGIRPGMPSGAAASLLPGVQPLHVLERDPVSERRLLTHLAWLGMRFSSRVSISAPDGLLIEVGGSLRLFGGLAPLCEAVRRAFVERLPKGGASPRLAVAPFPAAAELLARTGLEWQLRTAQATRAALAPLPINTLDLPRREQADLDRLGVTTIGACLRLPRDGLARRLSPRLLQQIDQLWGRASDPRATVVPPVRFSASHAFPLPTTDIAHLLYAAEQLLCLLNDYLTARCGQVQQLLWHLGARTKARVEIRQGLAGPGRPEATERRRWCEMFAERLSHTELSAPIEWITLSVPAVLVSAGYERALIETFESRRAKRDAAWQDLLTRLSARLGPEALQQVSVDPDPRPEIACRCRPARQGPPPSIAAMDINTGAGRPLFVQWPISVLPTDRQRRPMWGGPLRRLTPRERIEAGWWEGEDSSRDYYVARNAAGEQGWLCRVLPRGDAEGYWYLQGTFD